MKPLDTLRFADTGISVSVRRSRLQARRKFWRQVHLWLGLAFGLVLAIIGLTGSVLVFTHEIDVALNPNLYRAEFAPDAIIKSMDEIVAAAKRAAPPGWQWGGLYLPQEKNLNYMAGFGYSEPTAAPEEAVSLNIAVNPFTAEAVGRRVFYHAWNPFRHCFVGFFFKLHYALFLQDFGVVLVGAVAALLVISPLTGLILWWPLDGKWHRVLTIKRRASAARFNHDLHQSIGFYTVVVLLVLLTSGIYLNLPEQFGWLVERFSPLTPDPAMPPVSTRLNPGSGKLETTLRKIQADYPGGRLNFISFFKDNPDVFNVCYSEVPELRSHVLDTRCLLIDRDSGKALQVRDPAHGSGGDVFLQWQFPLHSGQVFGWTGRILVFLTGLACPVLFITGLVRWLQKQRAKQSTRDIRTVIEVEGRT